MHEWIKRQSPDAVAATALAVVVLAFVLVIGLASATGRIGDAGMHPTRCSELDASARAIACPMRP